MNYYQHHIGDFIRDTARLTDTQSMLYLRLLWQYYESEQSIDDNIDAIAFRIGSSADDVRLVLQAFFFLHDGRWHQARCDAEILKFRGRSKKAKNSALARWENAKIMRTQCERNANASTEQAKNTKSDAHAMLTNNQQPTTNNQYKNKDQKTLAVSDEKTSLPAVRVGKIGFDYTSGKWLNLKENIPIIESWKTAYPAVDIRAEMKSMAAWLMSNPKNKKHDMVRFANSWLKKEQDRGGKKKDSTGFIERHTDKGWREGL